MERVPENSQSPHNARSFYIFNLLEKIYYPASRQDILDYALGQGVEDEVLDILEDLPDALYYSQNDASKTLEKNSKGYKL